MKVLEITSVSLIALPFMAISSYDDKKTPFDWEIINKAMIMLYRCGLSGSLGTLSFLNSKG